MHRSDETKAQSSSSRGLGKRRPLCGLPRLRCCCVFSSPMTAGPFPPLRNCLLVQNGGVVSGVSDAALGTMFKHLPSCRPTPLYRLLLFHVFALIGSRGGLGAPLVSNEDHGPREANEATWFEIDFVLETRPGTCTPFFSHSRDEIWRRGKNPWCCFIYFRRMSKQRLDWSSLLCESMAQMLLKSVVLHKGNGQRHLPGHPCRIRWMFMTMSLQCTHPGNLPEFF